MLATYVPSMRNSNLEIGIGGSSPLAEVARTNNWPDQVIIRKC